MGRFSPNDGGRSPPFAPFTDYSLSFLHKHKLPLGFFTDAFFPDFSFFLLGFFPVSAPLFPGDRPPPLPLFLGKGFPCLFPRQKNSFSLPPPSFPSQREQIPFFSPDPFLVPPFVPHPILKRDSFSPHKVFFLVPFFSSRSWALSLFLTR